MASGLRIYWNVERQDSDRYKLCRLYRGRENFSLCRDYSQLISSMVSTIRLITIAILPSPLTSSGPYSHWGISSFS